MTLEEQPRFVVGWRTDVGARPNNEDALCVTPQILAVCDGMGGHAAGDVASALAANALASVAKPSLAPEELHEALLAANSGILGHVHGNPQCAGMGTTVTGIAAVNLAGGPHVLVFNMGDSRVYHGLRGQEQRATVDHSEVQELIAAGEITQDEARTHPHRNIVTRTLGEAPMPELDTWISPPNHAERYIICTDGLCGVLSDDTIRAISNHQPHPQAAADALVSAALDVGGRDNITVIVGDLHLGVLDQGSIDEITMPRGLEGQP